MMIDHRRCQVADASCVVLRRGGLTLLELIVVLAILAALSTIAVQSVSQSADQSRFELTQRLLGDIRAACVGDTSPTNRIGDAVSGFVADVGRLPLSLEELVINANNIPPFAVAPAAVDGQNNHDVLVPRGWRGPYLHLPIGATTLKDGWGRVIMPRVNGNEPFSYSVRPVTVSSGGASVTINVLDSVASLGADGLLDSLAGSVSYNADLGVALTEASYRGAMLTGQVYTLDGNGDRMPPIGATVKVKLFGPDPLNVSASGIQEQVQTLTAQAGTGEFIYRFLEPTLGPRVLRVELNDMAAGAPTYVVVRPGETMLVDLRVATASGGSP